MDVVRKVIKWNKGSNKLTDKEVELLQIQIGNSSVKDLRYLADLVKYLLRVLKTSVPAANAMPFIFLALMPLSQVLLSLIQVSEARDHIKDMKEKKDKLEEQIADRFKITLSDVKDAAKFYTERHSMVVNTKALEQSRQAQLSRIEELKQEKNFDQEKVLLKGYKPIEQNQEEQIRKKISKLSKEEKSRQAHGLGHKNRKSQSPPVLGSDIAGMSGYFRQLEQEKSKREIGAQTEPWEFGAQTETEREAQTEVKRPWEFGAQTETEREAQTEREDITWKEIQPIEMENLIKLISLVEEEDNPHTASRIGKEIIKKSYVIQQPAELIRRINKQRQDRKYLQEIEYLRTYAKNEETQKHLKAMERVDLNKGFMIVNQKGEKVEITKDDLEEYLLVRELYQKNRDRRLNSGYTIFQSALSAIGYIALTIAQLGVTPAYIVATAFGAGGNGMSFLRNAAITGRQKLRDKQAKKEAKKYIERLRYIVWDLSKYTDSDSTVKEADSDLEGADSAVEDDIFKGLRSDIGAKFKKDKNKFSQFITPDINRSTYLKNQSTLDSISTIIKLAASVEVRKLSNGQDIIKSEEYQKVTSYLKSTGVDMQELYKAANKNDSNNVVKLLFDALQTLEVMI